MGRPPANRRSCGGSRIGLSSSFSFFLDRNFFWIAPYTVLLGVLAFLKCPYVALAAAKISRSHARLWLLGVNFEGGTYGRPILVGGVKKGSGESCV